MKDDDDGDDVYDGKIKKRLLQVYEVKLGNVSEELKRGSNSFCIHLKTTQGLNSFKMKLLCLFFPLDLVQCGHLVVLCLWRHRRLE